MTEARIADTPRYDEWKYLREHGQWRSGVPTWARGHNGTMNDMTAAVAVIEELATNASIADTAGATYPPCKGMNCGATDGISHSPECHAEHAAAVAGGRFVKDTDTAGAKPDESLSLANTDWRNLYEMVYGHECSFKCFMATVDDLAATPASSVADAEREFSELIDCYQSAESLRERVEVRREMMAAFRAALLARADGGKGEAVARIWVDDDSYGFKPLGPVATLPDGEFDLYLTAPQAECAPREAQPDGWKLVPVEPTNAMLDEITLIESFTKTAMEIRYKAMLDAAPTPERADADTAGAKPVAFVNGFNIVWMSGTNASEYDGALLFAATPASSVADAAGASERERFEAWLLSEGYPRERLVTRGRIYVDDHVDDLWDGWQARAKESAGASEGQADGFVFPPMPHAVVQHEKVGPLFDRLSMQFYAAKCMRAQDAEIAALESRVLAERKPAGYVIAERLENDDTVISLYKKPEGGARKPLFTHPAPYDAAMARAGIAFLQRYAFRPNTRMNSLDKDDEGSWLRYSDVIRVIDAAIDRARQSGEEQP